MSRNEELAECCIIRQFHTEAMSECTAHIKYMSSRFQEQIQEREMTLQTEIALQRGKVRQLQLKLDARTATSSHVPQKAPAAIDWYDISSQHSDENEDVHAWQNNLSKLASATVPPGLRDSDGTVPLERLDQVAFKVNLLWT